MLEIRAWTADDVAAVDALLDADPDPVWAQQGHRLHGAPRESERWRRTWVAEQEGAVVGAVTLGRNWVHPDRYSCAVEVAPGARRHGTGRSLVEHARAARPQPQPLSAKVRERDRAGRALAASLGATAYQSSPCPRLDPRTPQVRAWCEQHRGDVASLAGLDVDAVATAFAELYRWIHAGWSPVGPEHALAAVSRSMAAEVDRALSTGCWRGGRLAAVAFVFAEAPGRAECVLETVRRDEPDGVALVAAVLAGVLTAARETGLAEVELDGHDTDPHLAPVVASLPTHADAPLLLVELT